jgi:hypothetical protein
MSAVTSSPAIQKRRFIWSIMVAGDRLDTLPGLEEVTV